MSKNVERSVLSEQEQTFRAGLMGSVVVLLHGWRKAGSVAGCTVAATSIVHFAITTPPGIAASQRRPDILHSWSGMPEKQVAPGEMSQY